MRSIADGTPTIVAEAMPGDGQDVEDPASV
jgi:hypothetical protein